MGGVGVRRRAVVRLVVRALLAVAGGVLAAVGLPPGSRWWAAVAGVAVVAFGLRGVGVRWRAAVGFLAGLGYFAPALWWATSFHAAGYLGLVVLQAAFVGAAAAAVPPARGLPVALPGAVVLAEAARRSWPFGGFPLASPAWSQVDGPLLPLARLGGPLLVILAAAAVATAAVAVLARRGRALLPVLVVAGLGIGLWLAPAPPPTAGRAVVATVQGGGPRGVPAVASDPEEPLRRHLAASRAVPDRVDLVVWPEDVVTVDGPFARSSARRRLSRLARRVQASLIVGIVEIPPGRSTFRNAAVVLGPDGRILDRYDKQIRVPFGEYVPARGLLGSVVDLSRVPRDAVAGQTVPLLATPVGPVAVAISYEGLFPRLVRSGVRAGGELVAVPTNAASYIRPDVPSQQIAAARLRAVETGRTVVQAAPTGYSAIITPNGTVTARSGLGQQAVLTRTVRLRTGPTPFSRTGHLPTVVLSLGLVTAGWIQHRRSPEGSSSSRAAAGAPR